MEAVTLSNADVVTLLSKNYVITRVDCKKEKALSRKFEFRITPTSFILTGDGDVIEKLEGDWPPKEFLGETKKGLEKFNRLQSCVDQAKKEPDSFSALRSLGDMYLELELQTKARDVYDLVVARQKEPSKLLADCRVALMELAQSDTRASDSASVDRFEAAIAKVEEADPDGKFETADHVAVARTTARMLRKDYDGAVKKGRDALKTFPKTRKLDALLYVIAASLLAQRQPEEAKPLLQSLAEKFPDNRYGSWAAERLKKLK